MASGASVPMNRIERAHQMYREGLYEEALGFYTEALGMAKTKPQKDRSSQQQSRLFPKIARFQEAEECSSVLELDHNHTGALMLRAQTLVTLKEYHSALFDVNRLMELNPSSEVYQNLQSRLKTQLSLAPIPEAEAELEEEDEDKEESELKRDEEVQEDKDLVDSEVGRDQKNELETSTPHAEVIPSQTQSTNGQSEQNSSGWQAIPKPKGHTQLDYSRWDRVDDESSEDDDDDDDDEESQPRYRFRVKTVGVQRVK
ncbi:tetratricopeptide repeat (TPR)-like superfamily protein [Actinidia rufa]|uniref:Tetratricopeptide repeat (TPR)-like superfamily protein n=1 Tax=Actinidia rufa TaxID=165716 RepID=A0A7J0DKE2_9ERIC|nr:tetratricopeptide repeat (TPR)-like superfamily protein [Actinidia rufa]